MEKAFDVALLQRWPGHLPERFPVKTEYAHTDEHTQEHIQALADIRKVHPLLAGSERNAVGEGVVYVVDEALVDKLRLICRGDAVTPFFHHLIVGQQELDVGLAVFVRHQASFFFQSPPERGLGQGVQNVDGQHRDLR